MFTKNILQILSLEQIKSGNDMSQSIKAIKNRLKLSKSTLVLRFWKLTKDL